MKKWRIYFLVILFFSILFFCPQKIAAQTTPPPTLTGGVVLSEVLANARGAYEQGLEFVELLNTGNQKVDIAGWKITFVYPERGIEVKNDIVDFVGFYDLTRSGYTTEIPSGGYAVIVDPRYKGQYNDQIKRGAGSSFYYPIMVTVDANYLGAGNIPNERGGVRISDGISSVEFHWTENPGDGISWEYNPPYDSWSPSGNFHGSSPGYDNEDPPVAKIYTEKYYGKAPFTAHFQSQSYDPEGLPITWEWDFGGGNFSSEKNPQFTFTKPGSYEVILYVWDILGLSGSDSIEITVFSKDIIISEVLPNPFGPDEGREFVELYNGGNQTVNLDGWQIRDAKGNGIVLRGEKIKPRSYRVFYGNFYLNNTGPEEVNLYFPGGVIRADSVSFTDALSGFSLALIGGKFVWTYEPTPGKPNIFASQPQYLSSKLYSTSSKSYQSQKFTPYQYRPPKVLGITQTASDESLYPVGQDYRASGQPFLNPTTKTLFWLVIFTSFLCLILLLVYSKIVRQPIRGP